MRNANLLWHQFIQLLTQRVSQPSVLKRANTGGATELRKGLVGQIKGLVEKSLDVLPLFYATNRCTAEANSISVTSLKVSASGFDARL